MNPQLQMNYPTVLRNSRQFVDGANTGTNNWTGDAHDIQCLITKILINLSTVYCNWHSGEMCEKIPLKVRRCFKARRSLTLDPNISPDNMKQSAGEPDVWTWSGEKIWNEMKDFWSFSSTCEGVPMVLSNITETSYSHTLRRKLRCSSSCQEQAM